MAKQSLPRKGLEVSVTINDTLIPSTNTMQVGTATSTLGNRLKEITGKADWKTAPALSLEALATHNARHLPNGADAITTAAPAGGLGATNATGSSNALARSDHQHLAFDSTAATVIGTSASAGTSNIAARRDHVHSLPSGDRTKIDQAARIAAEGSSTFTSAGRAITHNLGHTNYRVMVIPTASPSGYLGEVWVIKANNTATIHNSGTAITAFDYAIITTS